MNDIKYPTVGFQYISGQESVGGWGLKFKCGICRNEMLMHGDVLSHSGFGEKCPQYKTVFEPVISDEGVFRLRIRILEPEWIETTIAPSLLGEP